MNNETQIMREADRTLIHKPAKCFGISLGMHLVVFSLMTVISSNLPQTKAPLIIDLTLDPGSAVKDEIAPLRQPLAPKRRSTPSVKPQEIPSEKRPAATDLPLPSPVISPVSSPQVPAVQETLTRQAQGEVSTNATAGRYTNVAAAATRKSSATQVAGDATPEKAKHRYLREHFTYIRDLVMKSLVYPHQARKMGWSGKVTVSFVVCEDGSAREIRVMESSGHPMLDKCAIETVRSVAPFPKPPLQAEIVIPVFFKLM